MNTKREDQDDANATVDSASGRIGGEPSLALQRIFYGDAGLRAGWSLLIFSALFAVLMFGLNTIGQKFFPRGQKPPLNNPVSLRFALIAESPPFLALLCVTWVMSKIEGRPNSIYGLGGSRKVQRFFAGLCWGVSCLSLLVLSLWKTGLLVIESRLLFGSGILRYGALWLFGFVIVGLLEEYLNRGYVQYTLTRGLAGVYYWAFQTRHSVPLGFWTAAIIISVFFGLGHGKNPGESPIGLLSAGLAALVFCLSLWRTGSLWWAIGFHASWDWAQSFLYGVADSGIMIEHHLLATHPVGKPIFSGGATGPEGSVLILAIMVLIVLIICFTLPRTNGGYSASLYRSASEQTG